MMLINGKDLIMRLIPNIRLNAYQTAHPSIRLISQSFRSMIGRLHDRTVSVDGTVFTMSLPVAGNFGPSGRILRLSDRALLLFPVDGLLHPVLRSINKLSAALALFLFPSTSPILRDGEQ